MKITIDKIVHTLRTTRRAARKYRTNSFATLARFLRLALGHGFSRMEIFAFGLLDPQMDAGTFMAYVSKRKLLRLQTRYNALAYTCLTEDKSLFYPYCRGCGIPTPELYAVLDAPSGWAADATPLASADDWRRFLADQPARDFVVKPTTGVHGRGLGVYTKSDAGLTDFSGQTCSAAQLYDALSSHPVFRRFVIQERVINHRELARLSGTASLQTTRIVTFIDRDQNPIILFAVQKIIGAPTAGDNFSFGQAGNLVAPIDLDTGKLGEAVTGQADGLGLKSLARHPQTGIRFEAFQLPFWAEAVQLSKQAAVRLLPIRTIGWDIALSPQGPMVLEANMWWDPDHHNALGQMGRFSAIERQEAGACRRGGDAVFPGQPHGRRARA